MPVQQQKWSGFTLIEVIVAVAIFGIMASIIFPTLFQFLDMRERVEKKHNEVSGLQKTFLFLANDMRYAVNRLSKDEYGEAAKTTLSLGENGLIEFVTLYPDMGMQGLNVPRRVRWQLEDGVLQRIQYPVMDPESDTRSMLQLLLEDVENVEIDVSHVEDGRDNTDNKWTEKARLPDLVEIRIELDSDIDYRRTFSMPGADYQAAIVASTAAQSENTASESVDSDLIKVRDFGTGTNSATSSEPAELEVK